MNVSQLPAGSRLRALYDYSAQNADELSFKFDDLIIIIRPLGPLEAGWLAGRLESGVTGIFPCKLREMGKVMVWHSLNLGVFF